MNTGQHDSLKHRQVIGDERLKVESLSHKIGTQGVVIEELAKMYLICLAALPSGKATVEQRDGTPEKQTKEGSYFLHVSLDWKFAVVLGGFIVWVLKSFVMPLLK